MAEYIGGTYISSWSYLFTFQEIIRQTYYKNK